MIFLSKRFASIGERNSRIEASPRARERETEIEGNSRQDLSFVISSDIDTAVSVRDWIEMALSNYEKEEHGSLRVNLRRSSGKTSVPRDFNLCRSVRVKTIKTRLSS